MRNKRFIRPTALLLVCAMCSQLLAPGVAYALTSGPSQPEVQSFEPAGTSDMVDLFTGDFNYNIPLLNVGDYPVNLSYHSGVGMDQEASWVGLGWNINPGVINRNVRGLPDDFNGDKVRKEMYTKPNKTYALTAGGTLEFIGMEKKPTQLKLDASLTIRYNNYRGLAFAFGLGPKLATFQQSKGKLTIGLGLSLDSQEGVGINPTVSFSYALDAKDRSDGRSNFVGAGLGASFNSRAGLRQIGLSLNYAQQKDYKGDKKKKNGKARAGAISPSTGTNGSIVTFGDPTYIPSVEFPQNSFGLNLRVSTGGAVMFLHGGAYLNGSYSQQKLDRTMEDVDAYGFLFAHRAHNRSLQDFNREKDGAFTKHKPNLPVTNFTYDMYAVSGQGIGGMYRPHRGDVGVLYDRETVGTSGGGSVGAEIGGGFIGHFGADITVNYAVTTTGKWSLGNSVSGYFDFVRNGISNDYAYEAAYFKQGGEMTVQDAEEEGVNGYYYKVGGEDAVRINLRNSAAVERSFTRAKVVSTASTATTPQIAYSSQAVNSGIHRKTRDKRNQAISYLSAEEARDFALDKKIKYYDTAGVLQEMDRVGVRGRKGHHISEITALRPDGMRYVYGIPAYNWEQRDATFNVQDRIGTADNNGLVSYTPGGHDKIENNKGNDHYYSAVSTPAFAHSYLLTDIVSPDYIDVTGDGVTSDDLGTYTKIRYTMVADTFNWRTPYEQNKAYYNEGLKSDAATPSSRDDRGSYIFGRKEIWHVRSIETKNHIAIFEISPRQDALGVIDRNGGVPSPAGDNRSYKLDKITLYSRLDYEKNGTNAEPIQTVHFEYDYSLCKGVPNTQLTAPNNGKLTLKKVYFTYGTSHKGRLNAYVFKYSGVNPAYRMKSVDRWGNYKREDVSGIQNADFPYVHQQADSANAWAAAWHLSEIKLPSGGKINVTYEADDYAYVQHRRAMQMFTVARAGASASFNSASTTELVTRGISFPAGSPVYTGVNNQYIFFKRDTGVPLPANPADYKAHVGRNYLDGITDLYFRFLVQLKGNNSVSKDYVPGYAEIEDYGVASDNTDYCFVKLKTQGTSYNGNIHPVTKSAWAFARLYAPAMVFPGYNTQDKPFEAIVGLFGQGGTLDQFISGIERTFRDEGHGMNFEASKSFIRLSNPTGHKFGGGSRVKKITMADNWQQLTGDASQESAEYGQVYSYTMYDTQLGKEISSGVAAYEPLLGNDENPWRRPVNYIESKKWLPSEDHYMEEPMGESFFPSPTVGYSRVTVHSYIPSGVSANRTGMGYTVNEYYTARDFPTIVTDTGIEVKYGPNFTAGKLFGIEARTEVAASQGYAIEVNDMHGKPKAELVYAQNKTEPLSEVRYFYNTDSNDPARLSSTVSVILPDGSITQRSVGKEVDFVTDMREQVTSAYNAGIAAQIDVAVIPLGLLPAPMAIGSAFPSYGSEHTAFRSIVTTKVIQRYGILTRTVAAQEGSSVVTENLAWDGESGEVLLTRTQNEYNNWVYNLTYPAHWAYKGMGPAYQNIGVRVPGVNLTSSGLGTIASLPGTGVRNLFFPGDEVAIIDGSTVELGWVVNTSLTSTQILIQRKDGSSHDTGTNKTLKILRSGRRNMHILPIATVSSLQDPRVGGHIVVNTASQVLQASAVEFADDWQNFCGGQPCDSTDCLNQGERVNVYATGLKGNWRQKKALSYVAARKQSTPVNLEEDGYFEHFKPYWKKPDTGTQWTAEKADKAWTWKQVVTKFDPYGKELENRDPLERYTAAVYGYNNTLPVIIGQNTRYNEMAFQGFEDKEYEDALYYGNCKLWPHFSVSSTDGCDSISTVVAHTGKHSLRIDGSCSKASIYRPVKGNTAGLQYQNAEIPIALYPSVGVSNCLEAMGVSANKKYVLNAWTRVDQRMATSTPHQAQPFWKTADVYDSYIEITLLGACDSLGSFVFHPSGNRIEGWQRIYGEFSIPLRVGGQKVVAIRIDFVGVDGSLIPTDYMTPFEPITRHYKKIAFFDDVRIAPFDANVKSYVYDPKTLRLMAELDNNNYATFYEYDQEGNLIRVKRETERGIATIKENRQNLPKYTPE
ncbi:MAG: hypothetical protein KF690_05225 [Bacteroidetes bacterium]|nr:hypothetical protein [Bacteroidota bacterium]